ncbi:hypothetical protein RIF29_20193 [Crotalaria pallida]|uniref:Uncharacterized protein n=1 Tax=Crotalaria pallida TaxID=3830 RepID=A0AAN9I643_CROPI
MADSTPTPTPSSSKSAAASSSSCFHRTVSLSDWWLIRAEHDFQGKRLAVSGIPSNNNTDSSSSSKLGFFLFTFYFYTLPNIMLLHCFLIALFEGN